MIKIIASVGCNGANIASDVLLVQKLLNTKKIPGELVPLAVDGKMGKNTIARIESFQKQIVKIINPDGRVDPGGKTFRVLTAAAARPGASSAAILMFSQKGLDLLKSIEEFATRPYDDQTGKDITAWVAGATIGYGHLISKSEWPNYKAGITQVQALVLFNADLSPYVNTIKTSVTANINQNEFDALVLLVFNIGKSAFINSSVLKLVNNPAAITSFTTLEASWKAWNKSQGVVNKGLNNRRQAEWNIYSKGVYQKW